ncbi:hypothetical protein M3Y98_00181100 [Aphelenchoides besseyi]|nr:hypothetical protein M3Y98_00181100 [Aphelenchoides besseyi]KAI6200117.1 hypothetical protein M3Y96_00699100 [Aphelenchoides besseyi]
MSGQHFVIPVNSEELLNGDGTEVERLERAVEVKSELRKLLAAENIEESLFTCYRCFVSLEIVPQFAEAVELQFEAVNVLSRTLRRYHDEVLTTFFESHDGMPNVGMRSTLLMILYFLCRCVQRVEKLLRPFLKEISVNKGRRNSRKDLALANDWFSGNGAKQYQWLKNLNVVLSSEPLRDVGAVRIVEATLMVDDEQFKAILEIIVKTLVLTLQPLEIITDSAYRNTIRLIFQIIRRLCVDYDQGTSIANELMDLRMHEYFHQTKTVNGFPFVDAIAQVDPERTQLRSLLGIMMELALKNLEERSSRLFMSRLAEKRPDVIYAQLSRILPLLNDAMSQHNSLHICFHLIKDPLYKCETLEQFYERESLLLIIWQRIYDENVLIRAKALNIWRQLYQYQLAPIHWVMSPLLINAAECLMDDSKLVRQAAAALLNEIAETLPFGEIMNVDYLLKSLTNANEMLEKSFHRDCDLEKLKEFEVIEKKLSGLLHEMVEQRKTSDKTVKEPLEIDSSTGEHLDAETEKLIEELEEELGETESPTSDDYSRPSLLDLIAKELEKMDPKISSTISAAFQHFSWNLPMDTNIVAYQSGFMNLRLPRPIQNLIHGENLEVAAYDFMNYALEIKQIDIKSDSNTNEIVMALMDYARTMLEAYHKEKTFCEALKDGAEQEKRYTQRHRAEYLYRRLIFALYHAFDWERCLPLLSSAISQSLPDELSGLLIVLKQAYLSKVRKSNIKLQQAMEVAWIVDSTVQTCLSEVLSTIFYSTDANPEVCAQETISNFLTFLRTMDVRFAHSIREAFRVTFQQKPLATNWVFSLVMKCNPVESDQETARLCSFLLESVVCANPTTIITHLTNLDSAHTHANIKTKAALLRVFTAFNTQELAAFPTEDQRIQYSTKSFLVNNVLKTLCGEFTLIMSKEWEVYAFEAVRFMFGSCINAFNCATRLMDTLFRQTRIHMQRVQSCRQMKVNCENMLLVYSENDHKVAEELNRIQRLFERQFNLSYEPDEPTQEPQRATTEVEDLESSSDEYQKLIEIPLDTSKIPTVRSSTKKAIYSRLLYVNTIGEKENETLELALRRLFFVAGEIILRMLTFYEVTLPTEVARQVNAFKYLNDASLFELQTLYCKRIIQSWPEFKKFILKERNSERLTSVEIESMCKVGIYDIPEEVQEEETGAVDVENETCFYVQQKLDEDFFVSKSLFGRMMPIIRSVLYAEQHYNKKTVHAARCCLGKLMLTSEFVCREYADVFFSYLSDPNDQYREDLMLIAFDFFYRFHVNMKKFVPSILQLLDDKSEKIRLGCFILMSFMIKQNLLLPNHRLPHMTLCLVDESSVIRDHAKAFFSQTEIRILYNQVLPSLNFLHARKVSVEKFEGIMSFLFVKIFQRIERPAEKCEGYRIRFCEVFRALDSSDVRMAVFISTVLRILFETGAESRESLAQRLRDDFNSYKHFLRHDIVYQNFVRIVSKWRSNSKSDQMSIEQFKRQIDTAHGTVSENEQLDHTQILNTQVTELLSREVVEAAGAVQVKRKAKKRKLLERK